MEPNRTDEVTRVLKELDDAISETARLQEAAVHATKDDAPPDWTGQRRNDRRRPDGDRRVAERRHSS